jgi:hypothetical protein
VNTTYVFNYHKNISDIQLKMGMMRIGFKTGLMVRKGPGIRIGLQQVQKYYHISHNRADYQVP